MKKLIKEFQNTNFTQELNNTNLNDKKKYSFLIALELVLMILVVLIQYFIRPKKINYLQLNDFLLGTLPSLFGAIGYVALIFVIHRIIKKKHNNYNILKSLLFSNLFTFLGFTIWEILRMGLNPFDLNDIIMTILGCIVSSLIIFTLFYKDLK